MIHQRRTSNQIRVAVIGHVDHGKSTLLGRLLFDSSQVKKSRIQEVKQASQGGSIDYAFFLDSFEEERRGQMTIDVCYVRYQGRKHEYLFIDNPGHKEFLKNMLSGASQAEAAVLLVSAAPGEGIQEQTKTHLKLVKLLGIDQLVVVINKIDLIAGQPTALKKQVIELLKKIGFDVKRVSFVAVSAKEGKNISGFVKTLEKTFQPAVDSVSQPLRFLVQDRYDSIVVGKIASGQIKKGNKLLFQPSGKKTVIKEIKDDGLVLDKLIERGEVGALISQPAAVVSQFTGQAYFLDEKTLSEGKTLTLRCGLAETQAKIKKVINNEKGFAQVVIATKKPLVIEKYIDFPFLGRFVLIKNKKTIALGVRIQ